MLVETLAFITIVNEVLHSDVRAVTAYTLSANETDSTPCTGAFNENLCKSLADGESICAANFVPKGTILTIEGYGACRVADRMARKNGQKVDILMKDKKSARQWGKRLRKVEYSL